MLVTESRFARGRSWRALLVVARQRPDGVAGTS